MRAGPQFLRSFRVLTVALSAAILSACSSDFGNDDASVRAASAARLCRTPGTAPAFALAGSAPGTILITAAAGAPAFEAFVQFTHANEPPVTGGRLAAIDAVSLTSSVPAKTFAAELPALHSGTTYAVTLQVMQDTDQAPECQKSLAVNLGTFTAT
jgi:hypothetical protein